MKLLKRFLTAICFILTAIYLLAGCDMAELDSIWCDRKVTINGLDDGTEWKNARFFFDYEAVTFGLLNDDKTLYMLMTTREKGVQRMIAAGGFTVWFDDTGGKKKKFGIRFPLGVQTLKGQIPENKDLTKSAPGSATPEQMNAILDAAQNEIEIIGPDSKDTSRMSIALAQENGIICKIGNNQGNLVYELQVPINRSEKNPYGVTSTGSRTIGICLETGKVVIERINRTPNTKRKDQDGLSGQSGSGSDESGMMGRRNRSLEGSERASNPGDRGMPQAMEPLEKWIKANLAESP